MKQQLLFSGVSGVAISIGFIAGAATIDSWDLGNVVVGASVVTGGNVVGAGVVGGASSTRTGDCTAASALDETTPEQPEIVNEIRPIDTTTNACAFFV